VRQGQGRFHQLPGQAPQRLRQGDDRLLPVPALRQTMVRFLLMLPLVLALSGCATALVAPDRPAEVGNDVTVMPQRAWNRLTNDPEAWTTQGPQIDLIRFFSGIRSGDALIAGVRGSRFDFDAKMLPNDIQDLVIATLQLEGNKAVRADNLA